MVQGKPSFLDQIPAPARMALFLFLVGAGLYLLYQNVYSPRLAQRSNLEAQIAALEQQVRSLEAQVRSHSPVTDSERVQWNRTQQRLEEKIPEDYRLPELIEQIAVLAQKSGLVDTLISTQEKVALQRPPEFEAQARATPSPAITSAAQARALQARQADTQAQRGPVHITDVISAGYFPVTITFHGVFRNQGQFLEDLSRLSQLVEIETVEINREYPQSGFRVILKAFHSGKVGRV